ncbi:2-oxoglutarate dehydrogenase complex dihydrolipoyllysine-residue succinyltransferase [Marinigracilibium pacificum]|uniref:Dihydrolipoyllysine-residue succinyltransferase component of 2-oxoglutarate dehydrogenase complex n=1 Tax=Marinigracilibium pacificum TaxID=2729599 RepID=A0A848J561_9BACT|nr:2-oxoglutarate dehydrogenase complex dihydrolipoyllysine-residue succinyltransferase [Marinigracilibium pacificum]NMM49650.1 2-oxoglutarate dehydrogenase complex dihydrolipoyllysine-residue succinyltransferase [Marinigracilibium pacificum]
MSLEMKIPAVGESITEVTIGNWLKQDGDHVEMDEPICEIESDKATFEVTAESAGTLKIKAEEGDTLNIGDVLCVIEEGQGGGTADSGSDSSKSSSSESSATSKSTGEVLEMKVPTVGESITEVTLGSWLKSDGDFVGMDEEIAEIESDKATFELTAEAQGILRIVAQEGDTLSIGDLICKIEVTEGGAPASSTASSSSSDSSAAAPSSEGGYAEGHPSPAAAKILAEKGIKPEEVQGTGPGGRITKEDAEKAQKSTAPKAASAPESSQPAAPAQKGERHAERKRMSSMRKTIAKRLVSVKNETAMLTTFNEVNMQPIMDIRKKYKDGFKDKNGVGLGFMSFFTKAVCQALLEWPAVNSQIDGDEMVYHNYCDISIAVSTPKGLVVPVIRNAEQMNFAEIESEIVRLALRARDGKLSMDEMQGGTFTITNGGIFGSMMSTPIINAPQSAILGMHNIVERAVVENGQVVVRPMMYLALSYDHRVIDGRESVSFLVRVKELLEDPTRLMLGV